MSSTLKEAHNIRHVLATENCEIWAGVPRKTIGKLLFVDTSGAECSLMNEG